MDTKKCSKCDNVKPLAEFYKNKRSPGGYRSDCKACFKRHYQKNKVAKAEYDKRYYEENKVDIAEQQKRHYEENKEAKAEYGKRYREENKPARAEKGKLYKRKRRATDPLFKLTHNIRGLIGNSFRNGGFNKKSKTAEILGCSFEEYYAHIESQFTDGMSWQRMSEIHIDHRLPLSAANTEEEILVLNHYRNLQPLWATENLAKSDSYCPDDLAAYFKKHLPT